jgi:NADPH-dependent 2,4-dienoyl-CoA reductase/sulfur reductase-like enzyme
MSNPSAVVVGGGLAGMAIAREWARLGRDPLRTITASWWEGRF